MNTTSFQTNHYNHLQQTQIQGQSGLKILAGEDLSTLAIIRSLRRQKTIAANAVGRMVAPADGRKATQK